MKKISSFISIIDQYRRPLIMAGLVINLAFGFMYTYCINSTVHQAVAMDKAQSVIVAESAHVAELESQYMQLTSAITLDAAYNQGFVDASTRQTYISEKSISQGLSFNAI